MGSNASKGINETTIIQTSSLDLDGDPRSPTPEITRTPLNEKSAGKRVITKNVDLRKTLEATKQDENLSNSILAAVIKNHLQTYDPRSPTQEFERTPIVISNKDDIIEEKLKIKSDIKNFGTPKIYNQNANCEAKNLCSEFLNISLENSLQEVECPLGSSTASNESIEQNISNEKHLTPTHLLETNFDYTEPHETSHPVVLNQFDKKNPLTEKLKILEGDPRSPSIGIDRTPIVVPNIDDSTDENVEEMSDDKLIKVLQNTNMELRQTQNNPEGILIYEDEGAANSVTPKKMKSSSIAGCRTPLSCVKNKADATHARSKSANNYDSKNQNSQSKIPVRASRIPRLKSRLSGGSLSLKGINAVGTVAGDCENTPPNSHRDCWAEDNSIVL